MRGKLIYIVILSLIAISSEIFLLRELTLKELIYQPERVSENYLEKLSLNLNPLFHRRRCLERTVKLITSMRLHNLILIPQPLLDEGYDLSFKVKVKALKMTLPHRYILLAGEGVVEPLDPVVMGVNLVGVVDKVYKGYSILKTITSPEVYLTVTFLSPDCEVSGFGIVRGGGGSLRLEEFSPESLLKGKGELVTSGKGLLPFGLTVAIWENGVMRTPTGTLDTLPSAELQVLYKRVSLKDLPEDLRDLVVK